MKWNTNNTLKFDTTLQTSLFSDPTAGVEQELGQVDGTTLRPHVLKVDLSLGCRRYIPVEAIIRLMQCKHPMDWIQTEAQAMSMSFATRFSDQLSEELYLAMVGRPLRKG